MFDTHDRHVRVVNRYSPKWKAWDSFCRKQLPNAFARVEEQFEGDVETIDYMQAGVCCSMSYWLLMQAVSRTEVPLLLE